MFYQTNIDLRLYSNFITNVNRPKWIDRMNKQTTKYSDLSELIKYCNLRFTNHWVCSSNCFLWERLIDPHHQFSFFVVCSSRTELIEYCNLRFTNHWMCPSYCLLWERPVDPRRQFPFFALFLSIWIPWNLFYQIVWLCWLKRYKML